MTDEMMSLRALLEKSADVELVREMVGFAAQRLMELEVESLTGAAHGQRSAERVTTATATATGSGSGCPPRPSRRTRTAHFLSSKVVCGHVQPYRLHPSN